jgi:integrase
VSAQLAVVRAEAPNPAEQSDTKNPTVGEIFAAYIAARENPKAYKKCKSPRALRICLAEPTKLWGDWRIEDFRKGSRARVEESVLEWLLTLKPATCRKRCTIMRAAFRHAWKYEMIDRSQEPFFELPPGGPPRERFVDPNSELPALLKELDRSPDHIRVGGLLMLHTGQRVGAILALTWDLVDFEKRVIRFRDTEAPEDRSKKRRVNQPLDDEMFDLLTAAKARATCPFVVEWAGRGCKTIYPAFKRALKRAGLDSVRLHDLRRSSATYLYNTLGDMAKAGSHLGDTPQMAEQTYVQKDASVNLPGIMAVSAVIANARALSK